MINKDAIREMLIDLYAYSHEVIWCVDLNTYALLYTNNACLSIWGYTPEEMMSDHGLFYRQLHPDDVEIYKHGVELALVNGRSYNEFRIIHRDGTVRYIKGEAIHRADPGGGKGILMGIAFDVTRENKLNEQLRISEQRFYTIANETPVLLWTAAVGGGLNFVNKAMCEFAGMDMTQLTGKKWLEMVHPQDIERIIQEREGLYKEKRGFEVSCRMRRFDGVYRDLIILGMPQYDQLGNFTGYIGSGYDVTEIRQLNDALQQRNKELKQSINDSRRLLDIINKSENVIVISDPEGRITWVNDAFERVSGYTHAEVAGKKPGDVLQGPDTDPHTIELMRTAIRNKEKVSVEVLNYSKNGSPYWLELHIEPVFENEEHHGYVAIQINITERKLNEQKLADTNKRIREVSFITSHRLRHEFAKIMLLLTAGKFQNNSREELAYLFTELEKPANLINEIIQQISENLIKDGSVARTGNQALGGWPDEIMLVDDDDLTNKLHQRIITNEHPGTKVKVFTTMEAALNHIRSNPSSSRVIFLDLNFPEGTGWDFLMSYEPINTGSPVVILTSSIDSYDKELAWKYPDVVEYITKPLRPETLRLLFSKS